MYKELCSVIAFYLCDFTLNYLRYGNYESYQYVTSACPTGAVGQADEKMCPILSSRGIVSQLEGGIHHVCSGLPQTTARLRRGACPQRSTPLCWGLAWFAHASPFTVNPRNREEVREGKPGLWRNTCPPAASINGSSGFCRKISQELLVFLIHKGISLRFTCFEFVFVFVSFLFNLLLFLKHLLPSKILLSLPPPLSTPLPPPPFLLASLPPSPVSLSLFLSPSHFLLSMAPVQDLTCFVLFCLLCSSLQ